MAPFDVRTDQSAEPPPSFQPSQARRRNRDDPVRAGTSALGASTQSMAPSSVGRMPAGTAGGSDGESAAPPGSAAQVLERGHYGLRFPAALEARFQADSLEPRRQWVTLCNLIGIAAICLGSLDLSRQMPDAPDVALRNLYWILVVAAISLAMLAWMPRTMRRPWHAEAAAAISLLVVNAGVIHDCTVTRADTMFTHSAALVSTLMYGCIAARLRFYWALGCAISSFAAYALFVHGTTPRQQLIVSAILGLMALSYVFALVANYSFEHNDRRNWLLRLLQSQQRAALTETSERLQRLSIQDPLTHLFNRRQFDVELGMAWSRHTAAAEPLALLMVDVDFFKRYNDTYGHPAGDACLVQVARLLGETAQLHGGVAARLGGEEFGLLLPGRTPDELLQAGAALCESVRAARIEHRASEVCGGHVTVSVGAAQAWPAPGGNAQALVEQADRALYQAKKLGRDRVSGLALDGPPTIQPDAPAKAPAADAPVDDALQDAAAPAPLAPPGLPAAPEAPYVETLSRFKRLHFPPDHEAAYRGHNAEQRRRHLLLMAMLGILIYAVYMWCNRAMYADVPHGVLLGMAGICAAMLVIAATSYFVEMPVLWREAIFSGGNAIVGIASAWLLSQSDQLTALAFSVSLALIPMFSGVAARQPFWFTCAPALITCVAAALLLHPHDAQQKLVAVDSVTMIATNTVFTLMLSYAQERGARKEWLLSQIERLQGEALLSATRSLRKLSVLDPLTGICNRRQFEDDLRRIWRESEQHRQPLSMLIVDVDFFKLYNDGYGHPVGDRCLKQVAAAINQAAQAGRGLAARLGGEEFGILLPAADAAHALQVGEQVCAAIRQVGIEHRHSLVPGHAIVTVSVGVASMKAESGTNRRALFAQADDALYQAKKAGRNRAAVFGVPLPGSA